MVYLDNALVAYGLLVLLAASGYFVFDFARKVWRSGGAVVVDGFGRGEGWCAGVLALTMANLALFSWGSEAGEPSVEAVLQSTAMYGFVLVVVLGFLKLRGRSFREMFGLRWARLHAVPKALAFIVAALPCLFAVAGLARLVLPPESAEPQEVVTFLTEMIRAGKMEDVWLVVAAIVVAAPLVEEMLFRGLIYGAAKRFLGLKAALIAVSALFGLVHLNAASLAPLIVLAVVLTLAYEATGTLWAPIAMHAAFNALMVAQMFFVAG